LGNSYFSNSALTIFSEAEKMVLLTGADYRNMHKEVKKTLSVFPDTDLVSKFIKID
jgi:hypothetical protein